RPTSISTNNPHAVTCARRSLHSPRSAMDRRFISLISLGVVAGCTDAPAVEDAPASQPAVENVAREALPPLCVTTQGRPLTNALARGCSALDVVQDREPHLEATRSSFAEARTEVGRARELADASRTLAQVPALIDRAANGSACDAGRALGDASRLI